MKKYLFLSLAFVFSIASGSYAQYTHQPSVMMRYSRLSTPDASDIASILSSHRQALHDGSAYEFNTGGGEGAGYSKKRTYTDLKHERNGGIALTIVGAVVTTAGVALIAAGAPKLRDSFNNGDDDFLAPFYETYFGVGSLLAGSGMTIGGIVTWIKKERRLEKYRMTHPDEM